MKTLTSRLTLFVSALQIALVYIIAWGFEAFEASLVYPFLMILFVGIVAFTAWFLGQIWEKQNPMYLTGNIIATLKDYRIWVYALLSTIFLLEMFYLTSEFLLPESRMTKHLTLNGSALLGFILTLLGGLVAYIIPTVGIYKRLRKHWE